MKGTLLIALGNRSRGDDAAGPLVAERVARRAPSRPMVTGALDAMAMLSAWDGYERVVVVDAARGEPSSVPGTVHRLDVDDTSARLRIGSRALARCSSHGGGLAEALALGDALGRRPPAIVVFAVEAGTFEQGAAPSPALVAALDDIADRVLAELDAAHAGDAAAAADADGVEAADGVDEP